MPKPVYTLVYRIEDDCLILLHDNHEYDIEFDRLNTAEKVVEWIRHLTKKQWITAEHCRAVVTAGIKAGAKCHYRC